MMLISVMGFVGVNAQTAIQTPKLLDNIYVGANVGATTPLDFNHTFPLNTTFGLKVGKNFTPIWGANVEGTTWFGDNHFQSETGSPFFKATYVGVNGTINLTNLFLGYNPHKTFDLSTEAGLGWIHQFNHCTDKVNAKNEVIGTSHQSTNDLGAKTGLVFAWNLGSAKAWQIYANPTIYWNLTGYDDGVKFANNYAQLALNVGVAYKFKTSNGTHNFKIWDVGAMNDEINSLRSELAKKPKEVVTEKVVNRVVNGGTKWVVFFSKGSADLTEDAKTVLDEISNGTTVEVVGHTSEEGSIAFNKRLSENRANAVANYLTNRGVKVGTTSGEGKTGKPQNRVVIVTTAE